MKISVIMSVYNGEKYLKESISSILSQSCSEFEFLITNDCSADNTEKIILEYIKNDNRILYYKNKEKLGLTKNLNRMIHLSKGELIARMDADDISCKDRFLLQKDIFKKYKNVDVVFSGVHIIDDDSKKVCNSWIPDDCKEITKLMPLFNYIAHPSVMIRKSIFMQIGFYDERFIKGQDHELWLRIIKNNGNFYYIKENLLLYRINPNSVRRKGCETYKYKISKVCIANKNKLKALTYINGMKLGEKVNIIIRCTIPFWVYRKIMYKKSSFQLKMNI